MEECKNHNVPVCNAVNESVRVYEYFSDRRIAYLRHDSASFTQRLERFRKIKGGSENAFGSRWRILGNELDSCVEGVSSPDGPNYSAAPTAHFFRRASATSLWLSTLPL